MTDANILLRLLLNDTLNQHQVVIALLNDTDGKFKVADTAIIEVIFVLERHYSFTRRQISEAILGLASLSQISCNQIILQKALLLFVKHSKLSYEDCYLATETEIHDTLPLWTFDRKLANQVEGVKLVKK